MTVTPIASRPVDAARAVAPVLREHAAETERRYRPAGAVVDAVRDAGLFALAVPRDAGGPGADLPTLLDVGVELGRACPSTAWVTSLNAGAKIICAALSGPEARRALFADPHAVVCSSGVSAGRAERDGAGFRVSGRWPMASGCELAAYASLSVVVPGDDGRPAAAGLVLVPTSALAVERSWDAAGLNGTGSHTLVAGRVPVAAAFAALADLGPTPPPAPPARVLYGAVLSHLAPMLGAAHGALDVVRDMLAGDRAPSHTTYRRLADSPAARDLYTRADQLVRTARRRALDVAAALEAPVEPGVVDRSAMRLELTTAAREARSAVELLLDLHGAGGFVAANPLQRFWRDLAVGSRYAGLNPYVAAEDHGRLLLDAGPVVSTVL